MARLPSYHGRSAVQSIELSDHEQKPVRDGAFTPEFDDDKAPLFIIDEDSNNDEDYDSDEEISSAEWEAFKTRNVECHQSSTDLPAGHVFEDRITLPVDDSVQLKPGMTIELQDGDFLRIKHIVHDLTFAEPMSTGAFYLLGLLLRRNRKVDYMLKRSSNELCIMVSIDKTDPRAPEEQELVKRPIADFLAVRHVILTNQLFPALHWRESGIYFKSAADIEECGALVCRWKFMEVYDLISGKAAGSSTEHYLSRLTESECDERYAISDVLLTRMWREVNAKKEGTEGKSKVEEQRKSKPTMPGLTKDFVDYTIDGDKQKPKSKKRSNAIICVEDNDDLEGEKMEVNDSTATAKRINRLATFERRHHGVITDRFVGAVKRAVSAVSVPSKSGSVTTSATSDITFKLDGATRHTYGDICAGAGGTTRGAQMAGLSVEWVLDHWEQAVKTLKRNFLHAEILWMDIFLFSTTENLGVELVDILHISFPCQPHSPAHTCDGKNDGANIAAGYSADQILLKTRPRVVTLEQTPGIITHRGGWHFRALVNDLTSVNYSVQWKIMNLAEYGAAQARKRLIIIASCPGEPLPPFPKPTHGNKPGRKPFTTINDAIAPIRPRNVEPHMAYFHRRNEPPRSGREPLRGCITGNGGVSNLHPSGQRTFTLQELACLQSFPVFHKFHDGGVTAIKKQIGNAVPPVFAKQLFETVDASLSRVDKRNAAYKPKIITLDKHDDVFTD